MSKLEHTEAKDGGVQGSRFLIPDLSKLDSVWFESVSFLRIMSILVGGVAAVEAYKP